MGRQCPLSERRRVLQELVCFCLVSKAQKMLWHKWITVCVGRWDWWHQWLQGLQHSQNPMLSPTMANGLRFWFLKPCRSTSNYSWLLMTSSFRLVLQVQVWFLFLYGLRKFLAWHPFCYFFRSQALLVVWQYLSPLLSQDVHQSVVWGGYSVKGSQWVLQRLHIGLGNFVW